MSEIDALSRTIAVAISELTREIARDEARKTALEVVRRSGAAPSIEWVTQAKAAQIASVTAQTIREWLADGKLGERGLRGRVNVARLREHLAHGGGGGAPRVTSRGATIAMGIIGGGR